MAGTQNGYSVTWGTVTTNFDGGTGYVILNYYDGTSSRFNNNDILSLGGNTYYEVVSITIYCTSPQYLGSYAQGTATRTIEDNELSNLSKQYYDDHVFYCSHGTMGTLNLGGDLEITSFSIRGLD